ncbi:MAG: hypothetical protein U1E62_10810 [Alsobacter sp.]
MSRLRTLTIAVVASLAPLPVFAADYTVHVKSGRPQGLISFSMNDEYCQYIPGVVPTIKVQPSHGRIAMTKITRKNTNKNNLCFGTEGAATVAVYQSVPGFAGTDTVALAIQHYDGMGRAVDRVLTFDVIVGP